MIVLNPLRKKGGIIIKKLNVFLMLLLSIFISKNSLLNVKAESANFYEAEYIDNIYMNKYQYSTKTIYYQKARFFRKTNTNEFAYCIEPFQFFQDNASYESTINPNNLSEEQINRISKIAHFGYGYTNHTDVKWYAITQMMIWQTADPNSGDYYFTDSLNGNRISPYDNEINEINTLINQHEILPSISNKTYDIELGKELIITDDNNVISNYHSNNNNAVISNNQIIINSNNKEGTYEYSFTKQDNIYNKPYIFYQANNSQNLIETGNLNDITTSIKVNIIKTSITITKIDKDTKTTTSRGEAELDGAKYTLYDESMKEIKTITIKDNQAIIDNLSFGKYYLKEITPGIGYTLNDELIEININKNNNKINLILNNKVIEKKIIIQKKYGETNSLMNEKDIQFDIYRNDEYIETITTNEEGIAETTLPYGNYTIYQKNTTEGYQSNEPFDISVLDSEDELIELKDLRIPVPNTHIEKNNINILLLILSLLISW